jgi:hypothetical protein
MRLSRTKSTPPGDNKNKFMIVAPTLGVVAALLTVGTFDSARLKILFQESPLFSLGGFLSLLTFLFFPFSTAYRK